MPGLVRPAVTLVVGLTLLTGIAAPLAVTGVAGVAMPGNAGGGLVRQGDRVVGAANLGQNFADPRYFAGRPSATSEPDPANEGKTRDRPYNGAASAASQLGPTSATLLANVRERVGGASNVPADAATASGSGLDPHISPENARRQVDRIAAARNLPRERVAALVEANTEGRELGLLGEPRVNVLRLNLALDAPR